MNSIQIYDKNIKEDEITELISKLNTVNISLERIDVELHKDLLDDNLKLKRLVKAYGDSVYPVTFVNGEILQIENNLSITQLLSQLDISANKIAKAGIQLNKNTCGKGNCTGCACTKTGCSKIGRASCRERV